MIRTRLFQLPAAAIILAVLGCAATAQIMSKPKVPPGRDPGGVAVAIVDTGVNYLLPEIADRLARDGEGEMIGLDLDDGSLVPFDRLNDDASLEPAHRGTPLASIVLAEAPKARLVTIRLKARDFDGSARAAAFAASGPARIVAVSGPSSLRALDLDAFRAAAIKFKDLLFVVAAGNGGKDLDAEPSYPASFALDNVLVIAAGDASGRLLADQNFGARTVDAIIPATDVPALGFEGRRMLVSGARAALGRATALAARISAASPDAKGAALKALILTLAVPVPGETPRTRAGVIAMTVQAK